MAKKRVPVKTKAKMPGFADMAMQKMPMHKMPDGHMMPEMPMMPKGSAAKKRAVKRASKKR